MSIVDLASTRPRLAAFGFAALLSVIPLAGSTVLAFDEGSPSPVNVDASGLALRGHDPVAYFTAGAAIQGDAQYASEHEGVTYHFASEANRDTFIRDPAAYLPAFGGFCAMGTAMAKKFDGDPALWRIVDGTLYLNVNEEAAAFWQADIPGNIAKANVNWPNIKDVPPKDL